MNKGAQLSVKASSIGRYTNPNIKFGTGLRKRAKSTTTQIQCSSTLGRDVSLKKGVQRNSTVSFFSSSMVSKCNLNTNIQNAQLTNVRQYSGRSRNANFWRNFSGQYNGTTGNPSMYRFNKLIGKRSVTTLQIYRYASTGSNIVKIIGNAVKTIVSGGAGAAFRFSSLSARLLSSIVMAGIAGLGYIEYKLNQFSAPEWATSRIQKFKASLENLKNKEWFKSSGDSKKGSSGSEEQKEKKSRKGGKGEPNPEDGMGGAAVAAAAATTVIRAEDDEYFGSGMNKEQHNDGENTGLNRSDKAKSNVLMQLTKRLLEIQTIINSIEDYSEERRVKSQLKLPSIVVIGSQSSGKSSVLEAIVGQEFLPKGTNMVTRRPIELTLINDPGIRESYGEFPELGLGRITDFKKIQRTLVDLNMAVPEEECVSEKAIELRIYSRDVPDLRLVDLPGYIQVTNKYQPLELKRKIQNVCEKYIREPNIILAVCAADVDLANSEALQATRRTDPLGVRTIGVVTKVDVLEPREAVRVLTQSDYPLHLGYVGVISKKIKMKKEGELRDGANELTETQYFNKHGEFRRAGVEVGVGLLREKLVGVLEESMSSSLSGFIEAVRVDLEETKYQIKVHYNDERITAESYLAECMDTLKQRFKVFQASFGRAQVRSEVEKVLQQRVLEICNDVYWRDQRISKLNSHILGETSDGLLGSVAVKMTGILAKLGVIVTATFNEFQGAELGFVNRKLMILQGSSSDSNGSRFDSGQSGVDGVNKQQTSSFPGNGGYRNMGIDDNERARKMMERPKRGWRPEYDMYWNHRLELASAMLARSGVGRSTTNMVADLIMANVNKIVNAPPLSYHPDTRTELINMAYRNIRSNYQLTVDQVENSIKPFKHELEIDSHEWEVARKHALDMLDRELAECKKKIKEVKSHVPSKHLKNAMSIFKTAMKNGMKMEQVLEEIQNGSIGFKRGLGAVNNGNGNSISGANKTKGKETRNSTDSRDSTTIGVNMNMNMNMDSETDSNRESGDDELSTSKVKVTKSFFGSGLLNSLYSNNNNNSNSNSNNNSNGEVEVEVEDQSGNSNNGSNTSGGTDSVNGTVGSYKSEISALNVVASPQAVQAAYDILSLQARGAMLQIRKRVVGSSACKKAENKAQCIEVFMTLLGEKLAYNAVLFINYELIHDFFFQIIRDLDNQTYRYFYGTNSNTNANANASSNSNNDNYGIGSDGVSSGATTLSSSQKNMTSGKTDSHNRYWGRNTTTTTTTNNNNNNNNTNTNINNNSNSNSNSGGGISSRPHKKMARDFANENPSIREYLKLIDKRNKLEEAAFKLNLIIREQQINSYVASSWEKLD